MKPIRYGQWRRLTDAYHGWRDGRKTIPARFPQIPAPGPVTTPHREALIRLAQDAFAQEYLDYQRLVAETYRRIMAGSTACSRGRPGPAIVAGAAASPLSVSSKARRFFFRGSIKQTAGLAGAAAKKTPHVFFRPECKSRIEFQHPARILNLVSQTPRTRTHGHTSLPGGREVYAPDCARISTAIPFDELPSIFWDTYQLRLDACLAALPPGMKAYGGCGYGILSRARISSGLSYGALCRYDGTGFCSTSFAELGDLYVTCGRG